MKVQQPFAYGENANHIFTSNPDYAWVFEEYLDWLEAHFEATKNKAP